MTLYRATNVALDTTTGFNAGTSITAASDVAMQLQLPSNQAIRLVEFGWSQDAATSPLTQVKIQTSVTASTLSTALSTTSVKPVSNRDGRASSLTMATTGTAVHQSGANVTPTSRTVIREIADLYVPQVYEKLWPLGDPQTMVGGGQVAETILQIVVKPSATVNATFWLVWEEL